MSSNLSIPARLAGFRYAAQYERYRQASEMHCRSCMLSLLKYTVDVRKRSSVPVRPLLPMTSAGMLTFLSDIPVSDSNLSVFMRYCRPLPLTGFVPEQDQCPAAEQVLHREILRSLDTDTYRFLLKAPKGVDRLIMSMLIGS